jgi:hypothetical protein
MRTPDGDGGEGDGGEASGDLADGFGGFGDGDDDLTTGWGTGADDESFAASPGEPADAGGPGDDVAHDDLAATFEAEAQVPLADPLADADADRYADGDHARGDLHGDVDGDGHPHGVDDADGGDEARSPFEFEPNDFRPGGLFGHAHDSDSDSD